MMMPLSGTMTCEPKKRLTVVVREMASPDLSTAEIWDVPWLQCLISKGQSPFDLLLGSSRVLDLESIWIISRHILRPVIQDLASDGSSIGGAQDLGFLGTSSGIFNEIGIAEACPLTILMSKPEQRISSAD